MAGQQLTDDMKRIIQGCALEGRAHEIPDRLKLWHTSDYEQKLTLQQKKHIKATTCLYWSDLIVQHSSNIMAAFQFAEEGIKCLLDCYFDPPEWDPHICYLWNAIGFISQWSMMGNQRCIKLLPSKLIKETDGQCIFNYLIIALPLIGLQQTCALLSLLLKKSPELPNSGWLLQWNFSASKSPITFTWIVKNYFYDSDIVLQLLEHGMNVHVSDVQCALEILPNEEYKVFHKLVKQLHKAQQNEFTVNSYTTLVSKKIYFAAILCSSLKKDTNRRKQDIWLSHFSNAHISSFKLQQLSMLLTPELRARLFHNFCSKKKAEQCNVLLDSAGELDKKIMLNTLNDDNAIFIVKSSNDLFEKFIEHCPPDDINEVFRIIYNSRKQLKKEIYRTVLVLLEKGCDVKGLSMFYSSGIEGTAIHGAVELCLRSGNTRLLSIACEIYKKKHPNEKKFSDSSKSSPYHLIAKFEEKDNTCDICRILTEFSLIDPTLKNAQNEPALQLFETANFSSNSKEALQRAVDIWNGEKGITYSKSQMKRTKKIDSTTCNSQLQQERANHEDLELTDDLIADVSLQRQSNCNKAIKTCGPVTNSEQTVQLSNDTDTSSADEKPEIECRREFNSALEEETFKREQDPDIPEEIDYSLEDLLKSLFEQPSKYFTASINDTDETPLESKDEYDEEQITGHVEVQHIEKPEEPEPCALGDKGPTEPDPLSLSIEGATESEPRELSIEGPTEPEPPIAIIQQNKHINFSSLRWEIFISKQAGDFLRASKTSEKTIRDIARKLQRIGEGERSQAICRHGSIARQYKLYETYLYRSARIIWCEDIQYSELESCPEKDKVVYRDVVKIIWITLKHTPSQLGDVIEKIKVSLAKSRNCNTHKLYKVVKDENKVSNNNNERFPRTYHLTNSPDEKHSSEVEKLHPMPNLYGGEFSVMQYHPFSEFLNALLNADPSKRECSISMSEEEHKIIKLPYGEPILLCGRSGTGKTTTCIYRMWNEFCTFWNKIIPDDEFDQLGEGQDSGKYLHQVFLTKSPVLSSQVRKEFDRLVKSCENLKKHEFDRRPLKLDSTLSDKMFPLFITARKFLFYLDLSLNGAGFFPRNKQTGELEVELNFCDYNEDTDPDELFVEYDSENEDERQDTTVNNQLKSQKLWHAIEVTADYFCREIWSRIQNDSKLDPLLVWTEIQSFIKGTVDAIESQDGYITKEQYKNLGRRLAPSFAEQNRDTCYDLFTRYHKHIAEQKSCGKFIFDENDLIFNVYNRLKLHGKENPLKWHVDHFYIDEVQDFTQAELWLLLKCCRNPNDTFCTGDIAQSIMKGVFFRFEDLRSLFFLLNKETCEKTIPVPKLHLLTENFRSHTGVLKLAQSIVNILKKSFPNSFQDSNLPSEYAMFNGPKPVLLKAKSKDELAAILLGNEADSSVTHELGAHQAIIVRSESARKKLPASLRDGIVLTVLEAKGLEFNDVLLYNFFSDSQTKNQWRLLYNLVDSSIEKGCAQLKIENPHELRVDEKQEEQLKSLSAELKHLYTAITRARVNLWIYDEGEEESDPFFYYCLKKDLVKLVIPDDKTENLMFAAPSANEQWLKQGDYYFKLRKWELAMKCYRKGKYLHKTYLTQGYKMVEEARQSMSDAEVIYKEAAKFFFCADKNKHDIIFLEKGIWCLQRAKLHEAAATLLQKNNLRKALGEWIKARNASKVEELTEQLGDYSGVVRHITQEGEYGRAFLKAVEYEKSNITLEEDVNSQQMAYELIRLRKKGEKADVSDSEALMFVSDRSIRATLLRETGKLEEAADEFFYAGCHLQAYRILEAKALFDKGYQRAKNDDKIKAMFLLYHVTSLIVKSKWKKTKEIDKKIKELQKSPFRYFQARAQILLGIIDRNPNALREAIASFKCFECLPGEILAYSSLKYLEDKTDPVDEDLYYSKEAHKIAESLSNAQQYEEVLRVHDIKHQGDIMFISPFLLEQNICSSLKDSMPTSNIDEDGMFLLEKEDVDSILHIYYSALGISFIKQSTYFTKDLPVNIMTSEFHAYLKSNQCKKVYSNNMDSYFKNMKALIEYCSLTGESSEVLDKETLFRLFSPHTAFHLHATKRNFNFLKSRFVNEYFTKMAMQYLTDSESTLEVYLNAFRLLTIFIGTFVADKELSKVMNSQAKYSFIHHDGNRIHIFKGWLITCHRIQRRDVTGAVWSVYNFFLRRIADPKNNCKQAISIGSINYIIAVFSTALFSMLAAAYRNQFLLPRAYNMLINNFDIFSSYSISSACVNCVYHLPFNAKTVWKQLNIFLSFLLGEDGSHYNVLYTALTTDSCIQNNSALFCLIQCLILAGNLYNYAHSEEEKENIHAKLVSIHKILRACRSEIQVDFITETIARLSSAKDIKDIFLLVSEILPGSELVSPSILFNWTNYYSSIEFRLIYKVYYPSARLKSLVVIQSDNDTNEYQSKETNDVTVDNNVPVSPDIEITDLLLNDEQETLQEDQQQATINSEIEEITSDGICLICGKNLSQEMSEPHNVDEKPINYKSHFESPDHKKQAAYKDEYSDWKTKIEKACHACRDAKLEMESTGNTLVKLTDLKIKLDTLNTNVEDVNRDMMKLCDWQNGIERLKECYTKLEEIKKEIERLKEDCERRRRKVVEMDDEEEVDILPVKETFKLKKKTKKRRKHTQTH